jgi:hypothetical protein
MKSEDKKPIIIRCWENASCHVLRLPLCEKTTSSEDICTIHQSKPDKDFLYTHHKTLLQDLPKRLRFKTALSRLHF